MFTFVTLFKLIIPFVNEGQNNPNHAFDGSEQR